MLSRMHSRRTYSSSPRAAHSSAEGAAGPQGDMASGCSQGAVAHTAYKGIWRRGASRVQWPTCLPADCSSTPRCMPAQHSAPSRTGLHFCGWPAADTHLLGCWRQLPSQPSHSQLPPLLLLVAPPAQPVLSVGCCTVWRTAAQPPPLPSPCPPPKGQQRQVPGCWGSLPLIQPAPAWLLSFGCPPPRRRESCWGKTGRC